MIQPEHDENLAADLEAELVIPLQLFGGVGKFEAKLANRIYRIHVLLMNQNVIHAIKFYREIHPCKPALLAIPT